MSTKFTITEFAGIIGKSRQWVYKLVNQGLLNTVNLNNKVYVIKDNLSNKYITPKESTVNPTVNHVNKVDNNVNKDVNHISSNKNIEIETINEIHNKTTAILVNSREIDKIKENHKIEIEKKDQQHQIEKEKIQTNNIKTIISIVLLGIICISTSIFFVLSHSHHQLELEKEEKLKLIENSNKRESILKQENKDLQTKSDLHVNELNNKLEEATTEIRIKSVEAEQIRTKLSVLEERHSLTKQNLESKNSSLEIEIEKLKREKEALLLREKESESGNTNSR